MSRIMTRPQDEEVKPPSRIKAITVSRDGARLLSQASVYAAQCRLLVERRIRVAPHPHEDKLRLLSRLLGRLVPWLEGESG
jgi:hypothetical protein